MYKTILTYIDGSPTQASRLRAAAVLASEHGAHLVGSAATGISWMDFALLAGSAGAPVPLIELDTLRTAAQSRLADFSVQAGHLGVASYESRLIEDVAGYGLLLQSRYADLVVLSQDRDDDPDWPPKVRRLPELLALNGSRPVLVVPPTYQGEPIPGTVVAGWDGRVPALRALDAALPLLRRAAAVKLVTINPDPASGLHGDEPGADMGLYLARHGVAVEVVAERTNATVGSTLADLARDCGAGLMVCGAYGHSRFHEWMLGGATRELLERAPVPLLIAH